MPGQAEWSRRQGLSAWKTGAPHGGMPPVPGEAHAALSGGKRKPYVPFTREHEVLKKAAAWDVPRPYACLWRGNTGDQAASSAIGLTTAEAANQPIPEHRKPMKKGGIPAATDPICGPHREVGP